MMARSAILAVLAVAALQCAARIDVVHKTQLPDKRDGLHRERFSADFGNCSLFAEYTFAGDEVVKKAWGDYFFGLRLGYSPKNGGWSIWDFLRVYMRTPRGLENVLPASRPVLFSGYSACGADFLAAQWMTECGKRLKLLFASYPAHRDWLFVKVDLAEGAVERIDFSAYPGNAATPEGRERRFATREGDWHLNRQSAEFKPVSPACMLYSRYVDDRFGNKLVFDERSVGLISVPKTSSAITVRFTPKKEAASTTFALGFFAHKDPDGQLTRFLGEDSDAVAEFMRSIDWDAEPDSEDFKMSVRIALSMGVDRELLNPVAKRYLKAVERKDLNALAQCRDEVMELRRRKTREELDSLGK